jgi:O-antigen/teichoic acid export membrane protein
MVRRNSWSGRSTDRLVAHNVIVGVSTVVAGALGFSMQAILSHRLMPADFGIAFAVLSLLMVIWLPSNALMLVVAGVTSRDEGGDRSATVLWLWHRYLFLGGLVIGVVCLGAAGWLGRVFGLPTVVFLPAAVSIPFGLALPILLGRLQGQQRFSSFSIILVGQAAIRLVAVIGFAAFMGAIGVLVGVAAGNVIVYLLALAVVGSRGSDRSPAPRESRAALRSLAVILPSSLALAILFGADVLVVKHFFNAGDAGRYAAVAALGRAIFWVASGIAVVLFPKASLHASRGTTSFHLVIASIGICLLGGIAGFALLSLGGAFVLTVFAGSAYTQAGSYLAWYAIAMTLLGGASVLVATGQARGRGDFLAVLIPVTLAEPLLIVRFHQSLSQVVQVLSLSMAVLFVGLAVLYLVQERVWVRPRVALEGSAA